MCGSRTLRSRVLAVDATCQSREDLGSNLGQLHSLVEYWMSVALVLAAAPHSLPGLWQGELDRIITSGTLRLDAVERLMRWISSPMTQLSPRGLRAVGEIADRTGFTEDAVTSMLLSVIAGRGGMAQFSHPEFGGSGQWMAGGAIMISDMFNNALKVRVDACRADPR
jgi:hypothetical protein